MTRDPATSQLRCLSVIIPARDEEGCIASTVEHLDLELRLHNVPHEIVVVDDGSTDRTWEILQEVKTHTPRWHRFETTVSTDSVARSFMASIT